MYKPLKKIGENELKTDVQTKLLRLITQTKYKNVKLSNKR